MDAFARSSSTVGPNATYHELTTHQQYNAPPLDIPSLKQSPIEQFSQWFSEAQEHGVKEPEAFSIATVDATTLAPSVRFVLLKQVDDKGFVFYTNYESRKGRELGLSPDLDKQKGNKAAGCWYWKEMSRSVRIVGDVERLSPEESLKYYSTRPVGSQIGAHASPQSRIVQDRSELEKLVEKVEDTFSIARESADRAADDERDKGKKVPLPKNWGGVRIVPTEVEFWVGRQNRCARLDHVPTATAY
jgi:pyridoxamine-phosphate oxidase